MSQSTDSQDLRDHYEPPRIDPLGSFFELTTGSDQGGVGDTTGASSL